MRRAFRIPILAAALLAAPASAQEREVPYWASLNAGEINMRVGPSEAYPIDWVYKRQGLPVKVIRVNQGWRLVRDPSGAQGWIIARLLSPRRAAIVTGEGPVDLRENPDSTSKVRWRAEPGVSGALGECRAGWCKFDIAGRAGWVRAERLWGAGEP